MWNETECSEQQPDDMAILVAWFACYNESVKLKEYAYVSAKYIRTTFRKETVQLRGHVNKKKIKKSKKTLEVGGWVKKTYFYTFFYYVFGQAFEANNVINALLCLCSCFYIQVFVVNDF